MHFIAVWSGAVEYEVDDRAVRVERVHRCCAVRGVWDEFPQLVGRGPDVSWCERDSTMVDEDIYLVVHCTGLVAVEGDGPVHDPLPDFCVRCRLAKEVTSIEFGEGGVDVVGIERDRGDHPPVGAEFGDLEHLGVEGLRTLVPARVAGPEEGKSLAAGGDDTRRYRRHAEVGHPLQFGDARCGVVDDVPAKPSAPVLEPNAVGPHRSDVGPAPFGEARRETQGEPTGGVLERGTGCARWGPSESGRHSVQLRHGVVEVVGVERHLESDSALAVEADDLKHLVLRCAGGDVVGTKRQSEQC